MSTTYNANAQTIINSALRLQGWLDYTQTADSTKLSNMLEALNIMIKAWSSRGIKLWTIENITIPLQANKTSYSIGPSGADVTADRPLRIEDAPTVLNLQSNNSYELFKMARYDYLTLGNKQDIGQPSNYFYDDLIPNGIFYVYVTPDANTAANFIIQAPIRRYISDLNSLTDNFDFPSEWYQCLRWGLAAETTLENQTPPQKADQIEKKSQMYIQMMEDWDREWASVSLAPDRRGSTSGSTTRP